MNSSTDIEFYADIIFIINFVMDFFILWLVSKIIKVIQKKTTLRILAASFTASVLYILSIVFFNTNLFILAPVFVSISIFIAFQPSNVWIFFKMFCITLLVSFSVGGACMALYYYGGYALGNLMQHFSIWVLIISTVVSYFLIKVVINLMKTKTIKQQQFCTIKIEVNNKTTILKALVDTGNSLKEPISQEPVIVAQFSVLKEILPKQIVDVFAQKKENDIEILFSAKGELKLRLIPFKSVGTENGMLIGFKPNKIEIDNVKIANNAIIAIYNYSLSSNESYNALMGPELIQLKGEQQHGD